MSISLADQIVISTLKDYLERLRKPPEGMRNEVLIEKVVKLLEELEKKS